MSDPSSTYNVASLRRRGERPARRRAPGMSKTEIVRYEAALAVPEGECRITTAHLSAKGYGHVGIGGKHRYLHRMTLEVEIGRDLRDGEQANHTCHRRNCINPRHIYVGTQDDNMTDMVRAGRSPDMTGGRNPAARLTPDDVREARRLCSDGVTQREVADLLGVSFPAINKIITGRTWGHLA